MKLHSRQSSVSGRPGASGTARMDRRLGAVLRKLKHGDVAVIDHLDLDRASAEALLDHGVTAVVNASPFISGRYPNLGPELLARAGVVLVDEVGPDVFSLLKDGATVRDHRRRREHRVRRGRPRARARRRRRRDDDGPGARRPGHPAPELHAQHHGVPASRAGPAPPRPGRAVLAHRHVRTAGGGGRPGLRPRGRPAEAEALHRRPGPRARRGRRRRRRPARARDSRRTWSSSGRRAWPAGAVPCRPTWCPTRR